jgi:hypothetical protein
MAKLVFGMMQSLDGYVDGVAGGPQLPMPGAPRSIATSTTRSAAWPAVYTVVVYTK